ncbi:MAG: UDP-N-acetylmuramoyl-L-alanyl-D-glutamate--2,6-diaminopimelate ligase [Phycisphaerales bacterium]
MKLTELLAGIAATKSAVTVTTIADDSRRVIPGALFIARPGTRADGRAFVADAVARGAAAILYQGEDPCPPGPDGQPGFPEVVRVRVKDDADLACITGKLAQRIEGNPSGWLTMVGVTGTNGKTTMTFLVQQFLRAAGRPCGVIGTVVIDDGAHALPANLTTPSAIDIASALGRMVRNACCACAMEVSSHALDQRRVEGIEFRVGVFSNLTGDHLDYHGTMEAYAAAKARLFAALPPDGTAIVNADDPWHARMLQDCRARVLRCRLRAGASPAAGPADCVATVHASRLGWQDTSFDGPWGSIRVRLPIVGRHNAMNALEAAAAAHTLGVDAAALESALAQCAAPPGRLEPVTTPEDPFAVLVDYAHTDDALLNVLTALRPLLGPGGRLITVFGCGGDRDRTKRPRMMRVACEHSDRVVVTSDNPRTEEPESIIDEILTGRPAGATVPVQRQADRARAIELAVGEARAGDIVIIAGKGHEDYQIIGTEKRSFDDRLVARAALGRGAPAPSVARVHA